MIKTPELEQALLVLPFSQVESLANFLVRLLAAGLEVELCARCAVFLLRVHQVRLSESEAGGSRGLCFTSGSCGRSSPLLRLTGDLMTLV